MLVYREFVFRSWEIPWNGVYFCLWHCSSNSVPLAVHTNLTVPVFINTAIFSGNGNQLDMNSLIVMSQRPNGAADPIRGTVFYRYVHEFQNFIFHFVSIEDANSDDMPMRESPEQHDIPMTESPERQVDVNLPIPQNNNEPYVSSVLSILSLLFAWEGWMNRCCSLSMWFSMHFLNCFSKPSHSLHTNPIRPVLSRQQWNCGYLFYIMQHMPHQLQGILTNQYKL